LYLLLTTYLIALFCRVTIPSRSAGLALPHRTAVYL
jgi:hypothetical protein